MRSVVFAVVALVAVAVLALGPASAAPISGVLLALSVVGAALSSPHAGPGAARGSNRGVETGSPGPDLGGSGVGDEPGPLRP